MVRKFCEKESIKGVINAGYFNVSIRGRGDDLVGIFHIPELYAAWNRYIDAKVISKRGDDDDETNFMKVSKLKKFIAQLKEDEDLLLVPDKAFHSDFNFTHAQLNF